MLGGIMVFRHQFYIIFLIVGEVKPTFTISLVRKYTHTSNIITSASQQATSSRLLKASRVSVTSIGNSEWQVKCSVASQS